MNEYESVCVGCKFARWDERPERFGECDHPMAVAFRKREVPLVLDLPGTTSIVRRIFYQRDSECATREAEP